MATKKIAAPAAKAPVVVAAEPVVEKPKAPAVTKAPAKVPPATRSVATKAADPKAAAKPKPVAKGKSVEEQLQTSRAALAAALEKVKAVKLTPRPAAPAKAAKPAKTEKPGKSAKAGKAEKPRKAKLVRDSFTMPENEYAVLAALKKRLQAAGTAVKKSEVLRAGVALLAALKDAELVAVLAKVEKIKTGRPAKAAK